MLEQGNLMGERWNADQGGEREVKGRETWKKDEGWLD